MNNKLNFNTNLSLRARIFLAMTVIVVATFVLISLITIPQFKTQSEKYHSKRLERKEAQIQRSIAYFSRESESQLNPKKLDFLRYTNLHNFCFKFLLTVLKIIPNCYYFYPIL